jgi:hypothetical protein
MPQKTDLPEILAHVKTADGLTVQLRRDPAGCWKFQKWKT